MAVKRMTPLELDSLVFSTDLDRAREKITDQTKRILDLNTTGRNKNTPALKESLEDFKKFIESTLLELDGKEEVS